MSKETVAIILIILVAGYFAYAAFLEVERRKWYRRYFELEEFIDECGNTRDNWRIVTEEARLLRKSGLIKDPDMSRLEKKIFDKFLWLE